MVCENFDLYNNGIFAIQQKGFYRYLANMFCKILYG